jgi:N-acetylneuraminate synthase
LEKGKRINLTMIIAEIGQAHEGSLGIAHSYIDALSGTGVDAIKFQTHIAEAESSEFEPFRIKFSYEDKSRFDYWKRMEFSLEQWKGLKEHCEDSGLEFISSPFSNTAVDLLESVGVKRYKIGSGEVSNYLLLEKISHTGKPLILSSGMSSFLELDKTVEFLNERNVKYSILQCTTAYPTQPKEWGLNVLGELKRRYNVPVGFSDHSGEIFACLAAAALGAEIFEFHVTFHSGIFGPDTPASITLNRVSELLSGIKKIRQATNNPWNKSVNTQFNSLKTVFEKSLAINRHMDAGEQIRFEDLEAKKPNDKGIPASEFLNVVGKKLLRHKEKWDFISYDDIQ